MFIWVIYNLINEFTLNMLIICEKEKSVSVFDVTYEMDKSDHTRL